MESTKKNIRPYVSKRKRNESYQQTIFKKANISEEDDIKRLFITDSTVLQYGDNKTVRNNFPKAVLKSVSVCSTPVWSVKWCTKFSHLIGCCAESSLNLYDVMKDDVPIRVYTSALHSGFLRDLDWSRTSRQVATCSFDKTAKVCDFLNGGVISQTIQLPEIPTVIRWNPESQDEIIVGGHKGFLATYDLRSGKKIVSYESECGDVIALDMFHGSGCFVAAGDAVSRQSPEHALIVWDIRTGAKLSSQIFHERYSCPSVRTHPSGSTFLAQTNGNYIARFSANKPYKLDRCMRYENHRVEGYPVGFDLSPDGAMVASGSCDGKVVCYKYTNGNLLKTIFLPEAINTKLSTSESNSVISVQWHPILPSMIAVSDWSGRLLILR